METIRAMPILQVIDVAASVRFYADLGFVCHGTWQGPPDFAIVQRGTVSLGLSGTGAGPQGPEMWACYVYVSDVDALHREVSALGLAHVTEPCDEPYGCRDFEIADLDGYRIAFGQDMNPDMAGPGLSDDRGAG